MRSAANTEALKAGIDGPTIDANNGWRKVESAKGKNAEIFNAPKIYPSLSGLETSADFFFGHLRETEGGFGISVIQYWHAFDFPLLRAQDMRKGKELLCGSE
jgi:hypothetical protein